MTPRALWRAGLVTALALASCGRPTDDDVEDACQIQFTAADLVPDGRNFTLTSALPQSCVSFLTSGSGEVKLRLVVEPANGAEICLGSVKLAGQPQSVTSSELCSEVTISHQANTPWVRPLKPTPTSVEISLRNANENASEDHLASVTLELMPRP